MTPDLLHVVAAYNNPVPWKSRRETFRLFIDHMVASGVQLTVVECAYGEHPFEWAAVPGINHVPVRARTMAWIKENLINLGIQRLPHDWKYVAWIDGDVIFRRKDWATATVHALQHYYVVQPWDDALDLGPNGEIMAHHKSFCAMEWHNEPVVPLGPKWWKFAGGPYEYPHSGYAWAATRQAIDWLGGLIEIAAMGAGDHHMALALVGAVQSSVPMPLDKMPPGYSRPLLRWQASAAAHINRNIGYVQGAIEHQWHGRKGDRKYIDRWDMILEHGFDPDHDLKRNVWGVLELAGNKPALTRDLDHYFKQRNEDANTLG